MIQETIVRNPTAGLDVGELPNLYSGLPHLEMGGLDDWRNDADLLYGNRLQTVTFKEVQKSR